MAEIVEMTALERAAAAVWHEIERQSDAGGPSLVPRYDEEADLEHLAIDGTIDAKGIVRAVLTAIREPSNAMKNAAHRVGATFVLGEPYDQWYRMIDAALADEG